MKVCRICKKEYDDSVTKCSCGSTMFKQVNDASPDSSDYDRIKSELAQKRKNRSYIIAGIAIVIIVLIISGIVKIVNFASDPQRDIDAKAKEQYEQAVEYLKDEDYDAALKKLDEIDSRWSDYDKVYNKRTEAIKGILKVQIDKYLANENYEGLLKFLNKYSDEVKGDKELTETYNDVSKKYVAKVLAEADTFVGDGDYESAINVLKTANRIVGGSTEITAKLDEIEEATIMSKVQSYEKDQDYVSIIKYLRKVVSDNPEYNDLLEEYYEKYEEVTLAEAEKLANERKFQDAINLIEDAQIIYDCSEFESYIENYTDLLPKKLVDCIVVDSTYVNGRADIRDGEDVYGKKHSNIISMYSYNNSEPAYIIFNLDRKYTSMECNFIPTSTSSDGSSIYIYLDNELAYTLDKLSIDTDEISTTIDISNIKLVKIECRTNCQGLFEGSGAIVDATVS